MQTVFPLPRMRVSSVADVRESRSVALFTSGPAWDALGGALKLNEIWRAEPSDATETVFAELTAGIPEDAQVIYAVGGGLPFDAAKFAAHARGLPLVGVPTALSTDAPLTPASGIRRDGCVTYLPTGAPQELIVDWEVIAAAPAHLRATGFAEMLAITIGSWDWAFAERAGRNPAGQQYLRWAAETMAAMHRESLSIAAQVGAGEIEALKALFDMLALQVQLCSQIGHSRPQEGSEHYFAYSVENLTGHGLPHADLIGPGIVAMAAVQGQDHETLRAALLAAGIRLDRIPQAMGLETFNGLADYSTHHRLAYGIAHSLGEAEIETAMRAIW